MTGINDRAQFIMDLDFAIQEINRTLAGLPAPNPQEKVVLEKQKIALEDAKEILEDKVDDARILEELNDYESVYTSIRTSIGNYNYNTLTSTK